MIRVTVKLSGLLRKQYKSTSPSKDEEVVLDADSTVAELLALYGIAPERAHLIIINRYKADHATTLKDGDELTILQLTAGG